MPHTPINSRMFPSSSPLDVHLASRPVASQTQSTQFDVYEEEDSPKFETLRYVKTVHDGIKVYALRRFDGHPPGCDQWQEVTDTWFNDLDPVPRLDDLLNKVPTVAQKPTVSCFDWALPKWDDSTMQKVAVDTLGEYLRRIRVGRDMVGKWVAEMREADVQAERIRLWKARGEDFNEWEEHVNAILQARFGKMARTSITSYPIFDSITPRNDLGEQQWEGKFLSSLSALWNIPIFYDLSCDPREKELRLNRQMRRFQSMATELAGGDQIVLCKGETNLRRMMQIVESSKDIRRGGRREDIAWLANATYKGSADGKVKPLTNYTLFACANSFTKEVCKLFYGSALGNSAYVEPMTAKISEDHLDLQVFRSTEEQGHTQA